MPMRRPAPAIEPVSAIPSNSAAFPGPIAIDDPSRIRMRGSNPSFIRRALSGPPSRPSRYSEAAAAKNEELARPCPARKSFICCSDSALRSAAVLPGIGRGLRASTENSGAYASTDHRICFPQNCLVRSAPDAAPRELAVYDHTRQASNSVLLCPCCDVSLMHVVNFDVVVRARNALDQIHRLVTRRATSGENLNLSPLTLGHLLHSPLESQL